MIPAISNNTTPSGLEPNLATMPMETIEQALEVFFEIGQQLGELTLANRALQNKDISGPQLIAHQLRISHVIQMQQQLLEAHPMIAVEQIKQDFIKQKIA